MALSPILIACVCILSLTGEKKIIYRQTRIGQFNKPFRLLKFATMLENSPQLGSRTITVANDPRILPFGIFLRKTKLNELPQLINVIAGEMSLVGPRPLTNETFSYYTEDQQRIISSVKPGLSGIGSLYFNDEETIINSKSLNKIRNTYKQKISYKKAKCEIWFVQNKSMGIYCKVILLTILTVLFRLKSPIKILDIKLYRELERSTDG